MGHFCSASAFDIKDFRKLNDRGDCVECILADADLNGTDLSGAGLPCADLKKANLSSANLKSADLEGAWLEDANLLKVGMNGAILCNTTMPDDSVIYSGC